MNKHQLFTISYPSDNENKLKLFLTNSYLEYGVNKAYDYLTFRNQLLLNSCNIDENNFNYILFKNYIFFLSKHNLDLYFYLYTLPVKDREVIEIFNKCINNNDFKGALKLYSRSFFIHELLCSAYIKNLPIGELEKINNVHKDKVDDIYNKINILKNTDLSFVREQEKNIKLKVSNR